MGLKLPFHSTLNSRLWLAFVFIVALPVGVVAGYLALASERALMGDAASQSREEIAQIAAALDEQARELSLWAAAISSDGQILEAASAFASGGSAAARALAAEALDRSMDSFFDYTDMIGCVQIFFPRHSPYLYRNSPMLFELPVDRRGWYAETLRGRRRTRYLPDLRSYSLGRDARPLLSVAVAPAPIPGRERIDALLVSFRMSAFDAFSDGPADQRELVLLDAAGSPLLSTADGVLALGERPSARTALLLKALARRGAPRRSTFEVGIRGSPYLISVAQVPSPGWRLVSAVPFGEIARSVDAFSRTARYALLGLLALFVLYTQVTFHEVIRPLRQVVGRMREVEAGNFRVAVDFAGPEEIERLGQAFNSMVREVDRLTAEKEANERERARLEIEALRLQINPHFLSNTLNSIRLMAAMTKNENIEAMTSALMKVVTDSFGREGSLNRVANEVEMLRGYVLIMKVRYGESFTVDYRIDRAAERLLMLRMLLQPIVENSILHGFQDLDRKGMIEVRARVVGESLQIAIEDNGVGMSPEAARKALEEDAPDPLGLSRVGLANVERRIKLVHGPAYGLSIESGGGTTVLMRLPIIPAER